MTDLLPCARCGASDGPKVTCLRADEAPGAAWLAMCDACYDGITVPWGWTRDEAIAAGNEEQVRLKEELADG